MEDSKIKLTLDGFEEQPSPQEAVITVDEPEEVKLTQEERQMVDEFSKKIDLTDSNIVLNYGVGAQTKIASFSEKTLESVRSKDLGEVGNLLGNVVTELKAFDEGEGNAVTKIFKKGTNKIQAMKAKYAKAESNISEIIKMLENNKIQLMKDIAGLDQMYELNQNYFKELSMYIMAGTKKLHETREITIPELDRKAKESGNPVDAQKASDLINLCNRFEKKLHDLDLTRMVSLQMAPQIRMVQNSDAVMVEKIQSTLVNTIPLWKSQMVLALGVEHAAQAVKAQETVTDFTNKLLKSNADKLKMATVDTAKAAERSIIDVDTIRHTNETLISALDEVRAIQQEGSEKRKLAEHELRQLEQDLKTKLMTRGN